MKKFVQYEVSPWKMIVNTTAQSLLTVVNIAIVFNETTVTVLR